MQIKGTTAIITGGASGLGAATAARLHELGANLVLLDVDVERGKALAEKFGGNALFVKADVTDSDQLQAAIDEGIKKFGRLEILVNCAGIGGSMRTVSRTGPYEIDRFKRIINVNLIGTFDMIRLTAWQMINNEPNAEGERGVIINTASIAAYEGQIGQVAYTASKAGIVGMTLTIARDLSSFGIRVCTIAPGIFDTPLLGRLPDDVRASLGKQVPFPQRLGRAEEYAQLAQNIIEHPMLNGETIRLDGALRMAPK